MTEKIDLLEGFKTKIRETNLTMNTIDSYTHAVKHFLSNSKNIITKKSLLEYKGYLLENYKPKTVNIRILAVNKFLEFLKLNKLKLKMIKIQQKTFIENVISDVDYEFLKNKLKENKETNWYFVVRYLAATGARVSELIQIKVESVKRGYIDIYGKGGKVRRLYIPKLLIEETEEWLKQIRKESGYLFLNRFGNRITTRGIAHQLKHFARQYGMNEKVIYPHSFRHRFAKNFLAKHNDIALLADLMGHEDIATTRIYLRASSEEQREIIDRVVTW